MQVEVEAAHAGIAGQDRAAFSCEGVAIAPRQMRQVPALVRKLLGIHLHRHRALRQCDVGIAGEEFTASQLSVDREQGALRELAIVEVEAAADVFRGDAGIGGFQAQSGHGQVAVDPQAGRILAVRTLRLASNMPALKRASFHACASNACVHAAGTRASSSAVKSGVAASRCNAKRARPWLSTASVLAGPSTTDKRIGRPRPPRNSPSQRQPSVAITPQRATPMHVAEAIAEVVGVDTTRGQQQLALRRLRRPVEPHADALQRGDTGRDPGDARLHRACFRRAHACQQQPWQQA